MALLVPSAVVAKDRDGTIRYANVPYARLHGLSVDEVTAERRLEIALRSSRDQLHNLAEWSPGMLYQFRHRADGG